MCGWNRCWTLSSGDLTAIYHDISCRSLPQRERDLGLLASSIRSRGLFLCWLIGRSGALTGPPHLPGPAHTHLHALTELAPFDSHETRRTSFSRESPFWRLRRPLGCVISKYHGARMRVKKRQTGQPAASQTERITTSPFGPTPRKELRPCRHDMDLRPAPTTMKILTQRRSCAWRVPDCIAMTEKSYFDLMLLLS